ncbi:MAG: RT0821/Lpp0805 family surface protein [Pseudomonadota bacterium]
MKYQKLIATMVITTALAGCVTEAPRYTQHTGNDVYTNDGYGSGISKRDVGTVLGGVGGAAIGSTMGKGNGRIAATAAGAILGGLIGNSVGGSLDNADASYANQTTQRALETAPAGQALPWRNPESGNSGVVIPQAPYQTSDGSYCREFQQKIVVGGKAQSGYGKSCRQADGSWQIVQ